MITLKTLPDATAQQVFDQVVNHLRTQKKTSRIGLHCAYRGDTGLMCAAGCLIADDEYDPKWDSAIDNTSWDHIVSKGEIPDFHFGLIKSLQVIHDETDVEDWEHEFKAVADSYGLVYTEKSE